MFSSINIEGLNLVIFINYSNESLNMLCICSTVNLIERIYEIDFLIHECVNGNVILIFIFTNVWAEIWINWEKYVLLLKRH